MAFKKQIFISIIVLFALQSGLQSKSYWIKYGWSVFEEAGDARSIALGNALSAAPGEIGGSFINPSSAYNEGPLRINYAHHSRFAGMISADYLSFPYRSIVGLPVIFHLVNEKIQDIPDTRNMLLDWGVDGEPGTNDQGEGNGILDEGERLDAEKLKTFDQSQWGILLSTSIIYRDVRIGIAAKGLFHSIGENYANGLGFIVGAQKSFWKGNTFGVVIQDFTTSWLVWNNGTIERTRPRLLAGVSQSIQFKRLPVKMILLGDIIFRPMERSLSDDFYWNNTGSNFRLGLELIYSNKINIQLGRNQVGLISTGLGVRWKSFGFQYAFQANSNLSLGQGHFISLLVDPDQVWKWFQ